jgi:hypothetical protein
MLCSDAGYDITECKANRLKANAKRSGKFEFFVRFISVRTHLHMNATQSFREHAVDQITHRLIKKAKDAYAIENYDEVLKIGAMQYPYNVSAAAVYYDMLKGDSYDRIHGMCVVALETAIPKKVRCDLILAQLELLSRYYENKLKGCEYNADNIKK